MKANSLVTRYSGETTETVPRVESVQELKKALRVLLGDRFADLPTTGHEDIDLVPARSRIHAN
jgi:hypothetical protein